MTRFARLVPMMVAFGLALGLVAGAVCVLNGLQWSAV